jgi:aryl-alcohol dehydrogenase-like predicted oxidoreductase
MTKNLIHKLALGTVQFGLDYGISNQQGKTIDIEVKAILDLAASHGITLLDTAQAYGNSEEVLGKWHQNRFNIVTKINPEQNCFNIKPLVLSSLTRLQISKLYAVLFHSAQSALNSPKAYAQLVDLREQGIIRKIGYSVYTPEELIKLIDKYGQPDLVQIPFSHLDRRFESIATKLHEHGVEIHSRSTFLQGLFFLNSASLKPFFNQAKEYIQDLENKFVDKTERASFLLNYVVSRPFIDKVVIGVNDKYQLKMNIEGALQGYENYELEPPTLSEEILLPYLWK